MSYVVLHSVGDLVSDLIGGEAESKVVTEYTGPGSTTGPIAGGDGGGVGVSTDDPLAVALNVDSSDPSGGDPTNPVQAAFQKALMDACTATPGKMWNATTGVCVDAPSGVYSQAQAAIQAACAATPGKTWNSATGTCVSVPSSSGSGASRSIPTGTTTAAPPSRSSTATVVIVAAVAVLAVGGYMMMRKA